MRHPARATALRIKSPGGRGGNALRHRHFREGGVTSPGAPLSSLAEGGQLVPDHRIPEPDQSLLLRVAQGDAEALGQLQQRHGGSVYALAYAILIDAVQADEVVAETFAFAWQRAAHVTDSLSGSVFAWLNGIARSQARALLQARDWPEPWFLTPSPLRALRPTPLEAS